MNVLRKENTRNTETDIEDYYAVKIGSLWHGFKQEHISFWALCAYFFFEYVRPQSIYPAIDVIPWSQTLLIIAFTAVFFDKSVKWVSNVENKLITLFFIVIILSGFFAFSPSVAWDNWTFFFNWFLVYFLVINILNTEKRLFVFLLLFLFFSFKMSQSGAVTWALRGFSFASWGLVGAGAWFRNSGEFAIQMLILLSLSSAFVFALKDKWGRYKKWFLYLIPITAMLSIIGSSSRGAQLALIIICVSILLKSKQRIKAIVAITITILAVSYFLPEEQIQRFRDMGQDDTSLQRMAYWDLGLEIMNDHPILGVGYYNWQVYGRFKYPDGVGPIGVVEKAHNIYFQVGAELGYTGLIIFIIMFISLFRINAKTRKAAVICENNFLYYLTYGLDAGLIGYLIAGIFVTVFFYPFYWVQMALIVATYSVASQQLKSSSIYETNGNKYYRKYV